VEVTALEAAEIQVVNALELVHWEDYGIQVEVCDHCGCSGCGAGNWISLRRLGDSVVWIPFWSEMLKGEWELSEYSPPYFLRKHGVPIFSAHDWSLLKELIGSIPPIHEIPCLTASEMALIIQAEAPGRVLGEFPQPPKLYKDLIVAVTEGELSDWVRSLQECLSESWSSQVPVDCQSIDSTMKQVEFWMELPGAPSWTPLVQSPNGLYLQSGVGHACVHAAT